MFTGIIESVGKVAEIKRLGEDARISVRVSWPDAVYPGVNLGDSVAINGTCLTAVAIEIREGGVLLSFDASHETLARTSLGALGPGGVCNIERALRVGDRLGGHWVTGHVDGTGTLTRVVRRGGALDLTYAMPAELEPEVVAKGSIAIDGVSLTVNKVGPKQFGVTIIPHTQGNTQLLEGGAGKIVNLETDLLAKYIRRMMGLRTAATDGAGDVDVGLLERSGFLG